MTCTNFNKQTTVVKLLVALDNHTILSCRQHVTSWHVMWLYQIIFTVGRLWVCAWTCQYCHPPHCTLELQTKVKQRFAKISQSKIREDFTITGTVPTRAFSWLTLRYTGVPMVKRHGHKAGMPLFATCLSWYLPILTVGYKPLCGPSFEALLYIHTIYNITPTCCCVMCKVYLLLFTTWDLGNILTSYFLASTTSRSGARSQMLLIDAVSLCKHAAAAYKPRVQIKFEMKNSSASSIKANCQC